MKKTKNNRSGTFWLYLLSAIFYDTLYCVTVPTTPLYTAKVNGHDIEITILHLMKYPEIIQGGQPGLYEVRFGELAELGEEKGCPRGKKIFLTAGWFFLGD